MKFKKYRDARNWVISSLTSAGYPIRYFNVDQIVAHMFTSTGIGETFELRQREDVSFRVEAIKAVKLHKRGHMPDGVWAARMRAVSAMLGVDFGEVAPDEMEELVCENMLIASTLMRGVA